VAHVGQKVALGNVGCMRRPFGALPDLDLLAQFSRAFLDTLRQSALAPAQLSHAELIERNRRRARGRQTERGEPKGLINAWPGLQRKRSGTLTPGAVHVARHHAEPVRAGWDVGVVSGAPVAGLHPAGIEALQAVTELDELRKQEA
jgi:hypothetical protein